MCKNKKIFTAKIIKLGKWQFVCLPDSCQFDEKEVTIQKVGHRVILFSKKDPWAAFRQSLTMFTNEFMSEGRQQPDMQFRDVWEFWKGEKK
jgi:antitoxin VapB